MKKNSGLLWLLIIVLPVISACAGPSVRTDIAAHPPRVLLVAQVESEGISDEDGDWLDPDFFDDENESIDVSVADPLEGFNRAMFQVNDKLYFWVLKPVALGYRAMVPEPARVGVRNFFYNIGAPVRIVNNILQGKGRSAEAEIARFFYNSTVGVLGFGNPAHKFPELDLEGEDLGQTLARWGIKDGLFLFLPGLGPTTLRDAVGMVGDRFLSPVNYYVEPFEASLAVSGGNMVNSLSLHIGDYESLKNAALDPYQAFRNGYLQLRQSRIKD